MKGFLSLLGITLIVGAFGMILLSFYGNPLEELTSQERKYAYNETRQNNTAQPLRYSANHIDSTNAADMLFVNIGESCENPIH